MKELADNESGRQQQNLNNHKQLLLLEEWKQSVNLYIDQDKRAFERIKMFGLVHAGLLALYAGLWTALPKAPSIPIALIISLVAVIISVAGLYSAIITRRMYNLAHAFILLRKLHGMLIEKALKQLAGDNVLWRTSNGILTLFTREHIAFQRSADITAEGKNDEEKKWIELKKEMSILGDFAYSPFSNNWKDHKGRKIRVMKHMTWMNKMLRGLVVLWIFLASVFPISALIGSGETSDEKSEVVVLNCEFAPISNGILIEIHLDGKLIESRPYSRESASVILQLPTGDHMLKIIAEGYDIWQRRIHLLKSTSWQKVHVRLKEYDG